MTKQSLDSQMIDGVFPSAANPLDLIPKEAFKASRTGQFEPKLTFDERCQILALELSGVSRPILALAFSVNRRTVTHICNPSSPHYKDTRKELAKEGKEEFIKKYVTEIAAQKVAKAVTEMPKEGIPNNAPTPGTMPSRRADKAAGIQVVKPEQCAYSHRLEIEFFDGENGEEIGWWYRDLDSKTMPGMWLHNGAESRMSSSACLAMATANLTDD